MKKLKIFSLVLMIITIAGICLTGCGKAKVPEPTGETSEEVQTDEPQKGDEIAVFHIENYGDITVRLFKNAAPKAVENFVTHAKEGYYDGVIFHRVINDFMIQGGDPNGDGTGGSSEKIKGEFKSNGIQNNISHIRGTISMARSSANNSASSQFFIMQKDTPSLDGQYAAFGTVTSGMDIVDKI